MSGNITYLPETELMPFFFFLYILEYQKWQTDEK